VLNPTGKSPQPPLLCLGCLLAGWGLGFLKALPTHLPDGLRISLCAGLWLGGVALGSWAWLTFKRHATTPEPSGVASVLLTVGPFRHTRNPLYLSLSGLLAGFGLMLDSLWVMLLTPVLMVLLDRLVIAREEARLLTQFGEVYAAYRRQVRRWL